MEIQAPHTPTTSPPHHASQHQGSPFSDYFTDEARSVSQKGRAAMPSHEVQQVLRRLNNLGAQMLRQDPSHDTIDHIHSQLTHLENAVAGTESSPDLRNMRDSGFIDDFHDGSSSPDPSKHSSAHRHTTSIASSSLFSPTDDHLSQSSISEEYRDRLLGDSQVLLERVSRANVELRHRFNEMLEVSDQYASELEESMRETLELRSENDALKAALNFDHFELLYLKLQLKALEVQIEKADNELAEDGTEASKRPSTLLGEDFEQWKNDWDDIDARFRHRRIDHDLSSIAHTDTTKSRNDGKSVEEEGDWKLDMSKKRQGRTHSITITKIAPLTDEDAATGGEDSENTIVVHTVYAEKGTSTEPVSKPVDTSNAGTQTSKSVPGVRFSETATVYQQVVEPASDDEDPDASSDNDAEDTENINGDDEAPAAKTPWQELMDSIADFTGMSNFD